MIFTARAKTPSAFRIIQAIDSESALRGFFYYTKALEGGETTSPLLTWIKTVNSSVAEITQYDVIVYAESTQLSSLKTGKFFESFRQAWEECLAET